MRDRHTDTDSEYERVIAQLAAVRETGKCNMLDKRCMRTVASECNFEELAVFLDTATNAEYVNRLQEMGARR